MPTVVPVCVTPSYAEGSPTIEAVLGVIYALAGRRTEAIQVADWLKKRRDTEYFSAAIIAQVLARLGERDEAMFWLYRAQEERDIQLIALNTWFSMWPRWAPTPASKPSSSA